MQDTLPSRKASVFAAARERAVRVMVRPNGEWRKDTWPLLFAELSREGYGFRSCAPGGSLVYVAIVKLMMEYLGERPDQKLFLELRTRLGVDLTEQNAFVRALSARMSLRDNAVFSDEAKDLLIVAVGYVEEIFERTELYCPRLSG